MEEGGEVRTKAVASPLTNPNNGREEGELSSDNDEIHTVPAAPFTAAASDLEEAGQFKTREDINAGRSLHKNSSRNFGELPTSGSSLSNRQRSTQKSKAPFVPFVIRFSDDESGSESEELMQQKASEIKGSALDVKENKKPPASLVPKSQLSQQKTSHVTNLYPDRASLSRTFTSSRANVNKQTSRSSGFPLIDNRYRGNFRTSNTKLVCQKQVDFQNLKSGSSKAQDLRQKIETMEKELKLKSAKQNKDNVSASRCNYNVSDSEIDVPNKSRMVSAEFTGFEVEEPQKKRMKLGEPHDIQQISDARQHMPPLQRVIQLGKHAVDNSEKKSINDHMNLERTPQVSVQSEYAQMEKLEGALGILSSGSQFANGRKGIFNDKSNHIDKVASNSSEQTENVADVGAKYLSGKSISLEKPHVERALEPLENRRDQEWGNNGGRRHLETPTPFLSEARVCNSFDAMGISQDTDVNMETLFEIEEMQDKELEEAQEYRHKCEMEERNALRAYRKAQRALIEANARCSHLYQKRELYSAHVRSLMIGNSRLLQSSELQTGKNRLKYVVDDDVGDLPRLSYQVLDALDVHDERDPLSNIRTVDDSIQIEQEQHVSGKLVIVDPCREPDNSTSTLQKDTRVSDRASSPSTSFSASTDENNETFPFDEKSVDSNLKCREREKVTHDEPKRGSSLYTSQDSLLLEASLRSQLFARFGSKVMSKSRGPAHSLEPASEPSAEHSSDEGQAETNIGNVFSSVMHEKQEAASGGNDVAQKMSSQFLGFNNEGRVENISSNCASPAVDPLDSCFSSDEKLSPQMKVLEEDSKVELENRNQDLNTSDYIEEDFNIGLNETQPNNLRLNSVDDTPIEKSSINIFSKKVGYYTSNVAIDPFWPLCVFELRGKCNNDECPWQHIKDPSCRNIRPEKSEILDLQLEVSKDEGKSCFTTHSSRGLESRGLVPPIYLVSLDMMKADLRTCGPLLVTNDLQCWKKCLSTSLVLSCMLTSDLPMGEPFLHGSDARIEVHGCWNNQSLYFCRNRSKNQLSQPINSDQILEVALLNISQEINKGVGRTEALKVLARSLEANSSNVILWVAYLHIYHSNDHVVGEDDMCSLAVELNQGSYELWLIFINTRMRVGNRLTAYNRAIVALCQQASAADCNEPHTSACILDLFLQYLNFFCSSGEMAKATEKIYELFTPGKNSECNELLLFNILPCLTLNDKCMFWFCCIYFIVYRKLPDAIVQRFEFPKEFNEIEWPSANLTFDEKHRAVLVVEMAVDSLALYLDSGKLQHGSCSYAARMFAINHVKCMGVLEGLECSKKLLDNYIKIYPSCLELVLMSAKMDTDLGDLNFDGFEDAIRNWDRKVPGVQCIWNKYANFAFQNGKTDFAKLLMQRWFHDVWLVQYPQSPSLLDSVTWSLNSSTIDDVFGLINLSMYRSFDNKLAEARSAIDMALKVASPENYKRYVKEHVSFMLSTGGDGELLEILKIYLADPKAISSAQPLSRKFIDVIKKPRVRNLVSCILRDLSSDFSVVNLVLEAFYGSSLLPKAYNKLENLVDLVEALMEIAPSNYQLALLVGKLLNRDFKLADVEFTGVSFWATSLITNSLFQAVPIPPEFTWIEAADTLRNLTDNRSITESFHKRALTAYPLSFNLWKSYLNFAHVSESAGSVITSAKERGVKLD